MSEEGARTSATVLLVEDEPRTREGLQSVLSAHGYRVVATDTIATAAHLFKTKDPQLVIVDLNLPDGHGLSLCEQIHNHPSRSHTPIVILTADAAFETKVSGFKAGADQYLVKPVAPRELILWVEALLRRVAYDEEDGDLLKAGDCEIDLAAHLVRFKDQTVSQLTSKEFDLFYVLVKRRPKVLSRKFVMSQVWHNIAFDRVVDSHMYNLRRKLPQELADRLQSVPGKGFRYFD